ncbi:MAG: hypothetical protein NVS9B1_19570 [Candidatus Dormibacteraceae bacterium]
MNRYRIGLLAILALVTVAAVVFGFQSARPGGLSPAADLGSANSGGAVSADLIPVAQRPAAPEFSGVAGWLNSEPLTVRALRGQVVLIDFWTYSCVNCVRTIPHLRSLHDRYMDRGLTIVGVHSPEFDFEKSPTNVAAAVKRLGVSWPVALDSQMATWNAFQNRYWPAEYLIDAEGRIAYFHAGEGNYDVTERAIVSLLGAADTIAPAAPTVQIANLTPELYAGSQRGALDNESYGKLGATVNYPEGVPPATPGRIQLVGPWADHGEYVEATGAAQVRLRFVAGNLFLVAESANPSQSIAAHLRLDGEPAAAGRRGPDLGPAGEFAVGRSDLFHLLSGLDASPHQLELTVPAGFRLYTFTFG